ncbi:amidohydrolase [Parvularcula dongshanensis]|uniref:Amidohydrolase 3 domain-containing protein n=1 Tax=Parvularcula dongshanensis TaxID=1173995 RepID=A0A840HZS7_9PROT|nr:amidohydrolase [Parvularcula dongshanensis]MBB4657917.1 hypothetical protein [Parvularcula dongshanensis]
MRFVSLLPLALLWASAAAQSCDQRLVTGTFQTGEGGEAEAVLIEDGVFSYVGAVDRVPVSVPERCVVALPEDAVALPGLTDGHVHLLGVGLREMTLNLEGTTSIEDLQDRVREAASETRGVLVGRGWIETGWPEGRMPLASDLDAVVGDRPVILTRADGHAAVVNTAALRGAGIDAGTIDPEGGRIVRDAEGRATGLLIDRAQDLVEGLVPPLTERRRREALETGAALYASRGWTGVHDMSVDPADLAVLRDLARRGRLPLRVASYVVPEGLAALDGPSCDETGRACVAGVKAYVDGALGSRGALLFEPYADEPGTSGLQLINKEEAEALYAEAARKGLQVATHAIGDQGNALVLDWYEDVMPDGARWRIEHAQIVRPQDIPRFSRLGVIASMQPSHAIGDLDFAPDRLGDARLDGAYAWASMQGTGAVVVGGSDAPVEQGDPRIELYAATERKALDGHAGPDWRPREAVSPRAALRMFTYAPAYALGQEETRGRIAPGFAADLSVFTGDPFGGPEEAEALFTMVGGELAAGSLPGGTSR